MKIIKSYTPTLPMEGEDGKVDYVILNVVLTENVGQFAVYLGVGSDEFVAKKGQKIKYERALMYYPLLEKEKYRD